jgi:hypothetical protein
VVLSDNTIYKGIVKTFKKNPVEGEDLFFKEIPEKNRLFPGDKNSQVQISYDLEQAAVATYYSPDDEKVWIFKNTKTKKFSFEVKGIDDYLKKSDSRIILLSPTNVKKGVFLVAQKDTSEVRIYRLYRKKGDNHFQATVVSTASLTSKLDKIGKIHSACYSDDYGKILLVDEEHFYNFTLLDEDNKVMKERVEEEKNDEKKGGPLPLL